MKKKLINLTYNNNVNIDGYETVNVGYGKVLCGFIDISYMGNSLSTKTPEDINIELIKRAGSFIRAVTDYCRNNEIDVTNGYAILIDVKWYMVKPFLYILGMVDKDRPETMIMPHGFANGEFFDIDIMVPIVNNTIANLNQKEYHVY